MYAIINGDLLPKEEAKILVVDLAIQRGYGVFDYFRTVNYQPLFIEDHLDRLYKSAAALRLPLNPDREELKKLIYRLIEKNNIPQAGIRVTLTGGYSEDGYLPATPNLLLTQSPFTFNTAGFETGTHLVTYEHQRQLAQIKTIDYLQAIYLQPYIKENKATDVLYYFNNEITECPRSNFFIVTHNNEIITPAKNILHGVTRKRILALKDFNVKQAAITLEDLNSAKEAFISSTTKQVLPVLSINGKKIGDGRPGALSRSIFEQLTAKY
jgi:branched-chain amino acid aminotransferase